ncbi:hypothetical protein Chor_010918, partial [Crotalus horridus]
ITHPLMLSSGMHATGLPHPGITSPSGKQEMDHYDRSMKSQSEPKREKEAKKPTIKKPLNAFMLYMKEMRAKVIAECTLKESAAINQILGRRWHALSREEQAKYYELARKERQLHMQLYPGWSARDNYPLVSAGSYNIDFSTTQKDATRVDGCVRPRLLCLADRLTYWERAALLTLYPLLFSLLQALHPVITYSLIQGPWNSAALPGQLLRQGEKRKDEQEKSSKTPIQITLFTVLRRKKKCIRYLQGKGHCSSPISSNGSTIDSPPSPLDVLQCTSPAFIPNKLAAPADLIHQNQANPSSLSAHLKTAISTSGLPSKCSTVPHKSIVPSETSGCNMVSIGT